MPDVHEGAVPLPPASVDFNALNDALAAGAKPDEARAAAVDEATVALSSDEAMARAAESVAEAPSLSGRTKPQLIEIAERETVPLARAADGTPIPFADGTNPQMVEAIQAKRDGVDLFAPLPETDGE